jgi:hypothetical protein
VYKWITVKLAITAFVVVRFLKNILLTVKVAFNRSKHISNVWYNENATVPAMRCFRTKHAYVLTLGAIILITLAANLPRCVTSSYILYSGLHVRTSISLKISNHFLLLNPVLDPVIHVLRIREYRDRLKSVCRCYNKANNNTGVITLTQAIHIWSGITVVTYSVLRESELRSLNKPHNTGVITLTHAIHIWSDITVVNYQIH